MVSFKAAQNVWVDFIPATLSFPCLRGHLQTILEKNNVIVTLCFNPPPPPSKRHTIFYTKLYLQQSAKQSCLPVTKHQAQPP